METVLLVIHVIIALGLIGMVLIQRSESDGFGLGGGSGSGFMTGRAAANFLTRTTAILATLFILNSLVLGIIASHRGNSSIVELVKEQDAAPAVPAETVKDAKEDTKAVPVKKEEKAKGEPSVPTGE